MTDRISSSYIHKLQAIYHNIDNRGIAVDREAIDEAKIFVDTEINRNLSICSNQWGCKVYIGTANSYPKGHPEFDNQVNINSSSGERTLLKKLRDIGYKVPTITKRNEDTGEYEAKYSAGELTLQKMLVTNQFNFAGGDPAIRAILQVRELSKLRNSYLNCRFYRTPDGITLYLSHYNAAGTLTGRRSSKKHTFGFGNNAQNFPKHGKLAKIFRRCLVARPGCIFLNVDQKGAEEWPVNALAENTAALAEMESGVNRHIRRAARIFGVSENSRTEAEWKDSLEYYLGKKTGHANNYGMQPNRMSDSLAQEGHSVGPLQCKALLEKLNSLEPQIRGTFHAYIKDQIIKTRILRTPFGRERQFLGLRPNDNNYKLFNEAFAYIPQSIVGDNNGFAVAELETILFFEKRAIVHENHDSIAQDIPATASDIWFYLQATIRAYDRRITFHNGISINIPVEAELGYNYADMFKIKDMSYDGVVAALKRCNELREQQLDEKRQQYQHQQLLDLANSVSA
jgi:DNA polymerase family A